MTTGDNAGKRPRLNDKQGVHHLAQPGGEGSRGPLRPGTTSYVGERERHRSRETGVVVVLIDTLESPRWLSDQEGRWVTLCDDHGFLTHWPSLSQARAWYAYPSSWCSSCERRLAG